MSKVGATARRPFDDRAWISKHLDEERRSADRLSDVREAMFGAQDGVISILAVVSAVATATGNTTHVLVAGLSTTVAEIISMAAGEYMSSKTQREVFEAQIAGERREVADRPEEALAEMAMLLEREGLSEPAARHIAEELAVSPEVMLKTMVEKELGLSVEPGTSPIVGALIIGSAFLVAALVPMGPFFFLPTNVALPVAVAFSCLVMFGLGLFKSRFTKRPALRSGFEVVALVAAAAVLGFLFGNVLPALFGLTGVTL